MPEGINADFKQLLDILESSGSHYNIEKITKAYEYACQMHDGQFRQSGEPYITHPLAVAKIVATLGLDSDSICAALLHDTVEDCADKTSLKELQKRFGVDVALLVDGLTKIVTLQTENKEEAHIETLRKMLLATVDGRVSAIFLARYRFAKNVKEFLEDLSEEDVRLMVRTKDPGVRNDLFRTLQPDTKDPVQVMKPTAAEMDIRTDRVDATIVALDSCMAAGETFLICRRIRRAGLFGRRLQVISMLVGAGLAMLLSFFGKLQVFTPTLLTVYIFFWSALDAVASYLYLRDKENV